MKRAVRTVARVVTAAALLYSFLVSIGLMETAFKGFGRGFAEQLINTTSNPFVGLFIGILATSLVQSSSTTTSMVVGIVASGGLTIANAVPIIMGANIGTTVTNTLVSLGHMGRRAEFQRAISGATVHDFFNLICVTILFPLELATGFLQKCATGMSVLFENVGGLKFTSPVKFATKPAVHLISNSATMLTEQEVAVAVIVLVVSFVILFLSLYFLVKVMKSLVVSRAEIVLDNVISKSGVTAIVAGTLFTIMVQSSSITTSLCTPLVAAGILSVQNAFPITLGANIGTTTTAILASFATANPSAIIIAFVHFLFNVTGVLFIYPIKPFREIPIRLALGLGALAARGRRYAFAYVVGVFFLVPGTLIFVSRLLS